MSYFSSSVPVILRTGLIFCQACDLEELKTNRASVNNLVPRASFPLTSGRKTRALEHPFQACAIACHIWSLRLRSEPDNQNSVICLCFFQNGCTQSSRFPTAGQGERSSGNEIGPWTDCFLHAIIYHSLPFISLPNNLRALLPLNFLIQVINMALLWREQTNKHRRVCLVLFGEYYLFVQLLIIMAISIAERHLSNNEWKLIRICQSKSPSARYGWFSIKFPLKMSPEFRQPDHENFLFITHLHLLHALHVTFVNSWTSTSL